MPGGHTAILRIAATGCQGTDFVANAPGRDALTQGHDLSGDFQAGQRGRIGRRRVCARPLGLIWTVHLRSTHSYQNFSGARLWRFNFRQFQNLWSAMGGDFDSLHMGGKGHENSFRGVAVDACDRNTDSRRKTLQGSL